MTVAEPAAGVADDGVFCVLPWVHLSGSVDGVWGRCCVDSSIYYDALYSSVEEPVFDLDRDAVGCLPNSRFASANPDRTFGLEAAFNSPNMRRTRLAMMAGKKVRACGYCYRREASGGASYRQKMNEWFAERVDVLELRARTEPDGRLPAFPNFLDLRFGNTCNLQCIMCGYPISSAWGLSKHPSWAPAHIDPYRTDTELWATIRENARELRRVYFAGGEPFLQRGHFAMLDLLVETGAAAEIDVVYTSNLSVLPAGIFDTLSKFRSVGIGASCDGTGEVFERIRTGASWKVFVQSLRVARERATVWLQVAPQRDNVLHLGSIIDFAVAEEVDVDMTNFVHWPEDLSIASLSGAARQEAETSLTALAADCRSRDLPAVADQVDMLLDFLGSARPQLPA